MSGVAEGITSGLFETSGPDQTPAQAVNPDPGPAGEVRDIENLAGQEDQRVSFLGIPLEGARRALGKALEGLKDSPLAERSYIPGTAWMPGEAESALLRRITGNTSPEANRALDLAANLQAVGETEMGALSADKEITAEQFEAPNILLDQRPDHAYRQKFGGFTQVAREKIHTTDTLPADLTLADANKWTNVDIPITVGTKNPTGVTSAGLYDGALGYDWMEAQSQLQVSQALPYDPPYRRGEGFVTSVPIPRTNPPRSRRLENDGGRAKVISGYVGDAHPTGVGFHIYHALREGFAAGVDNFSSLYERTNRTREYTHYRVNGEYVTKMEYVRGTNTELSMAERVEEAGGQAGRSHGGVSLTEGIRNVRDLAYTWTATGQPNRFRVFTTAIELTDSSLGKDADGIEKVDANDLRQSFVITLTSTGVEAGGDGVIEHIRQITGYNAANPTAALATFKEEFQEGMKMATDAGPGDPNRGRGPTANSIWKAETVDAFFADVNFTIEDGDLYVTMPNRAGTGLIRLRWGVRPSAVGA